MFILQLITAQSGHWIEADQAGNVLSQRLLNNFDDCPKIENNDSLIVLLPGDSITMMAVKMPKMRASERLKALPFVLEEQLASDPENIAVAIGSVDKKGLTNIAVFDKTQFEKQIQILREHALFPQAMLPDFLALPYEENAWSIALLGNFALVRTGEQQGFSVDSDNLFLLLQVALDKSSDSKPNRFVIFQDNNVIDTTKWDVFNIPIDAKDCTGQTVFDLKAVQAQPAINLLQGENRPKMPSSDLKKNWVVAIISALSLIGFLFLSNMAQWVYLSHEATVINNQTLLAYQKIFPGSAEMLEPKFRVASLLTRLQKESKGSEFLHLLAVSGKVLTQYPAVTMQSMKFSDGKLVLQLQTKETAQLTAMVNAIDQAGLTVQQHSDNAGQIVNATLTIGEQAS